VTVDEAVDALLGDQRTGDTTADLLAGLKEAMRRRERNTEHGGAVIAALVKQGMARTARAWAKLVALPPAIRPASSRAWALPASCDPQPRPDREGRDAMDDALEAGDQRVCHHVR
jgi:hypothetical protein